MSFSTDPLLRGVPADHVVPIKEMRLAAGAEFLVGICADVTMPGLPRAPSACQIDLDEEERGVGLLERVQENSFVVKEA